MGAVRNLNIAMSEDLAMKLDDAVANGGYQNMGELISDMLQSWQTPEDSPENIARLRRLWDEGIASGEGGDVTDAWFEDIKRRGHQQLEQMRQAK